MPDVGEKIKTPDGLARVVDTNILEKKIKARLFTGDIQKNDDGTEEEKLSSDIYTYKKEEIKRIGKHPVKTKENDFADLDAEALKEMEALLKD